MVPGAPPAAQVRGGSLALALVALALAPGAHHALALLLAHWWLVARRRPPSRPMLRLNFNFNFSPAHKYYMYM